MTFIEVHVTKTCKRWGSPEGYWFPSKPTILQFSDMKEVRAWLKETYGTSRRQGMFCDTKKGTVVRTGWVVSYSEYSDDRPPVRLACQDWVKVTEITIKYPLSPGVPA